MDIYSEIILDHYNNPRGKGKLQGANATAEDANPLCGDKVRYYLKIGRDGTITDVRFTGSGCAISQAAASMLAETLAGKKVAQVLKWDKERVFKLLGLTLTPARAKCALLGLSVLKSAILSYKKGKSPAAKPAKTASAKIGKYTKKSGPFNEKNSYYPLLNAIMDPDTHIGIADMGLIYSVKKEGGTIKVTMTLTSMGCPAGPHFTTEIDRILRREKGVKDVQIEIVWEPAWTPERIKPELRAVFGL
jgi:nitrogen fixation protein NifU and related proteins